LLALLVPVVNLKGDQDSDHDQDDLAYGIEKIPGDPVLDQESLTYAPKEL
jgi:hypothetical protein